MLAIQESALYPVVFDSQKLCFITCGVSQSETLFYILPCLPGRKSAFSLAMFASQEIYFKSHNVCQ